ncbi:MAG: DUF4440 domain-containing protein [Parvularculaceae bacterium]|nr:DUF4440 domain-containing protein [Parvularculaceae bacterium]
MRIALILAVAAAAATPAAAQSAAAQPVAVQGAPGELCVKGDDRRIIEIAAPGKVGAACDVVYRRSSAARASVPYFANSDADYCSVKAAELAGNLIEQGFSCTANDADAREAALKDAPGALATPSVDGEDTLNAQLADILNEDAANTQSAPETHAPIEQSAPAQTTTAQSPPVQEQIAQEPAQDIQATIAQEQLAPAPVQAPTPSPVQAPAQTLAQPAPESAPRAAEAENALPAEPVQLASDVKPSEFRAPEPPRSSGPGRLVGAQPTLEDIGDIIEAPGEKIVSADAAIETAAAANEDGLPARNVEDLIRNIFAANAAAWNEGNLDAYMRGYVNSAGVVYIENAVVTAGWAPLRKSFEKEISASGEMGRLSFDDLNVRMTTDDVATVVGKYTLARSQGAKTGVVTIVMNQVDGRWRISQETRIASTKPAN